MNTLQIFNFEGLQVRTVIINGEPWFVGKDVANILGYENGSRDINRHVDEEDRQNYRKGTFENDTFEIPTIYGHPKAIKKDSMTTEMLKTRQPIFDDTANLIMLNERLGLDLSVSKQIYKTYCERRG